MKFPVKGKSEEEILTSLEKFAEDDLPLER